MMHSGHSTLQLGNNNNKYEGSGEEEFSIPVEIKSKAPLDHLKRLEERLQPQGGRAENSSGGGQASSPAHGLGGAANNSGFGDLIMVSDSRDTFLRELDGGGSQNAVAPSPANSNQPGSSSKKKLAANPALPAGAQPQSSSTKERPISDYFAVKRSRPSSPVIVTIDSSQPSSSVVAGAPPVAPTSASKAPKPASATPHAKPAAPAAPAPPQPSTIPQPAPPVQSKAAPATTTTTTTSTSSKPAPATTDSSSLTVTQELAALRQKLDLERRTNEEKSREVKALRQEYEELLKTLAQLEKNNFDYTNRVDKFLIQKLSAEDREELAERRARHKSQISFLGELATKPGTKEKYWINSETYRRLDLRNTIVQQTRKEIGNKPRSKKGKEDDFDDRAMEEVRQVRVKRLKEEEEQVKNELKQLSVARLAWLHEAKLLSIQPSDEPVVLEQRYLKRLLLGAGGFAEVWKAFDLREMRDVAIKIVKIPSSLTPDGQAEFLRRFKREYEIQRKFSAHPHIVTLYDWIEFDSNSFASVLEYCPGEDLDRYIKCHQGGVDERDAKPILIQILSGLRHLNVGTDDTVIHYDLKPANILLDGNGVVKIADFGLSKVFATAQVDSSGIELTSVGAGTNWYLPPEVLAPPPGSQIKITPKVDVWSCGVLYYEMLYGKRPYGDGSSQDAFKTKQLWDTPIDFEDKKDGNKVSDEAKQFIMKCLTRNVESRPSVIALCEDSYVSGKKRSSGG